jgi:hypothetical protein
MKDQTFIDVYSRQDGLCAICGEPLSESPWEMHHMRRKADGGDDSVDNLVLLCDRDEHEYVHGGSFNQELETTADIYPFFYGRSGKLEYEEPSSEEEDIVEPLEPEQADNDSDVEDQISDGGMG